MVQGESLGTLLSQLSSAETALGMLNRLIPDLERDVRRAETEQTIAAMQVMGVLVEVTPLITQERSNRSELETNLETARSALVSATTAYALAKTNLSTARGNLSNAFRHYSDTGISLANHLLNCYDCRYANYCEARQTIQDALSKASGEYESARERARQAKSEYDTAKKNRGEAQSTFDSIEAKYMRTVNQINNYKDELLEKEANLAYADEKYQTLQTRLAVSIITKEILQELIPTLKAKIKKLREGEN